MKRNKLVSIGLTAIASVCLTTAVASADDVDVDVEAYEEDRVGLTVGVGLGLGHLECTGDYCEGFTEAGDLNASIGVRLVPQVAVTVDVWGMAHMEDRLTVSQSIATVGPQVWLMPRLWLRAGAGVARASYNYDAELVDIEDVSEWVPAGMTAAGFELLSRDNFALDLQFRAGTGFFNEAETRIYNMSFGVAARWF